MYYHKKGKWNPSKEREFEGMDMRYEDNFDAVNNMFVIVNKSEVSSVESLGDLDKALGSVAYLLGTQSYQGLTQSEGGFAENRYAACLPHFPSFPFLPFLSSPFFFFSFFI